MRKLILLFCFLTSIMSFANIHHTEIFSRSNLDVSQIAVDNQIKTVVGYEGAYPDDDTSVIIIEQTGDEISSSYAMKKESGQYRPMVEEGKTWWYESGIGIDRGVADAGISIGEKTIVNDTEYNKVYVSAFAEHHNTVEPEPSAVVTYDQNTGLLGYIREENGVVYFLDAGRLFTLPPHFKNSVSRMMHVQQTPEYVVADFSNKEVFTIHHDLEVMYTYDSITVRKDQKNAIENSGLAHNQYICSYKFTTNDWETSDKVRFTEGVGMHDGHHTLCVLFCYPFGPVYNSDKVGFTQLRYVTDADKQIIFEDKGGTKLWAIADGVADLVADDEYVCVSWYDLLGHSIVAPTTPGIYLKRTGRSVQKVVVR